MGLRRPYASRAERVAAYADFLHRCNHHRGHIALGVLTEDHFWRLLCDVLGLALCRDLAFAERENEGLEWATEVMRKLSSPLGWMVILAVPPVILNVP